MRAVCIGAGIVGLHVANRLHEEGYEVFVVDGAPYLAEHASGRNSGVIHAGIFYPAGSLKETTCIEGNRKTYEWARRLHVLHRECGKWILPGPGQENSLEAFFQGLRRLPIPRPEWIPADRLKIREPILKKSEAIYIPSTGLIDAAGYVKALARYLEERGISVLLPCQAYGADRSVLRTSRGDIEADLFVNAAGLFADEVAAWAGLEGYTIRPCRGDYFVLARPLVSKPVYPLPEESAHGLGVHLTPSLDGQTLIGPNAYFIANKVDYENHSAIHEFEEGLRDLAPQQSAFHLTTGYAGNRPKLMRGEQPISDFTIEKKGNWIHLLGIESPGLTAAPALAEEVMKRLHGTAAT